MDRNVTSFFPLLGQGCADLRDKPLLELLAGFDGAPADDERVRVESSDHLIEEKGKSVSLGSEYLAGEGITFLGEAADQPGRFAHVTQFGEFMVGVTGQKRRE